MAVDAYMIEGAKASDQSLDPMPVPASYDRMPSSDLASLVPELGQRCASSWSERNAGPWPTLIRSPCGRKGTMMLNRLHVFTIMTLAAVNEALAQATPPAASGSPAAPATTDGGGVPWLWIIIALVIIAGIVWYFMRGRSRATTAGTTSTSATPGTPTSHPKVFDNDKRK
jgi:hypothetical protein